MNYAAPPFFLPPLSLIERLLPALAPRRAGERIREPATDLAREFDISGKGRSLKSRQSR